MSPGAVGIFKGAMATPITRYCSKIKILSDSTFDILEFKFDAGEAQQSGPETVTYLAAASIDLREIKRFQLSAGEIMAFFNAPK